MADNFIANRTYRIWTIRMTPSCWTYAGPVVAVECDSITDLLFSACGPFVRAWDLRSSHSKAIKTLRSSGNMLPGSVNIGVAHSGEGKGSVSHRCRWARLAISKNFSKFQFHMHWQIERWSFELLLQTRHKINIWQNSTYSMHRSFKIWNPCENGCHLLTFYYVSIDRNKSNDIGIVQWQRWDTYDDIITLRFSQTREKRNNNFCHYCFSVSARVISILFDHVVHNRMEDESPLRNGQLTGRLVEFQAGSHLTSPVFRNEP